MCLTLSDSPPATSRWGRLILIPSFQRLGTEKRQIGIYGRITRNGLGKVTSHVQNSDKLGLFPQQLDLGAEVRSKYPYANLIRGQNNCMGKCNLDKMSWQL